MYTIQYTVYTVYIIYAYRCIIYRLRYDRKYTVHLIFKWIVPENYLSIQTGLENISTHIGYITK